MNSILFKNASALEDATNLDIIAFAKAGTLTIGQPKAVDVVPGEGFAGDDVLRAASAVERGSDQPRAVGVVERSAGLDLPAIQACLSLDGRGAQAEIGGDLIYFGHNRLMDEQKIDLGPLGSQGDRLKGERRTVVHVAQVGSILDLIAIADAVRISAKAAVAKQGHDRFHRRYDHRHALQMVPRHKHRQRREHVGIFFQKRLRQIVRREVRFKVALQRIGIWHDAEADAVQPFDAAPFELRISVVLVHFDFSFPCVVASHFQLRISGMSSPYCRM